jgi:hypothetical protein
MPLIVDAARDYVTLGEMCDALREVWGDLARDAGLLTQDFLLRKRTGLGGGAGPALAIPHRNVALDASLG